MTINPNISDLFFNTDHHTAVMRDEQGMFAGYSAVILQDEAKMFLNCLERLNVAVPSVEELIEDFYSRI